MTQQQSTMRTSSIILICIGVFFAIAALPVLHPVVGSFLKIAYWPLNTSPLDTAAPVPLLVAITGGLTAGLGGMLWSLGTYVSPVSPEAVTNVTKITAWFWFCTDSSASILVGAPFNAVLNLSFLLLMLFASRSHNKSKPSQV